MVRAAALASIALAIALASSSCGGRTGTIRIGLIADCDGFFSPAYQSELAAAELPLLERGGRKRGPKPSDGVGATVAGKRIEIVVGCERYADRWTTIEALRHLVEQESVRIVIGTPWTGDDAPIRDYAKSRPDIIFLLATGDQSATLKRSTANVFRFTLDQAQQSAGLGAYAYRTLGWRRVATVGEDDPSGWPQVAGFIAEFCSLGGKIDHRRWAQPDSTVIARVANQITNEHVDGVYFAGNGLLPSRAFVAAWRKHHRILARSIVGGVSLLYDNLGLRQVRRAVVAGVVGVSPTPIGPPTRSWSRYANALATAYGVRDFRPYPLFEEHDAMEAVLEALAQVHGDTSDHERRLMQALAHLTAQTSVGPIRLDARHQAIGPAYLATVAKDANGKYTLRKVGVVSGVEQTYGGYFSPTTPAPSRTQPACVKRNPPSWAMKSVVGTK